MNWISTLGAGLLVADAVRIVCSKKQPRREVSHPKKRTREKIVATTAVGRPEALSEKHTIVTTFHDFADLPGEKEDFTSSEVMSCHGHPWTIETHPGGRASHTNGTEPSIAVYLCYEGDKTVKANYAIRIGPKMLTSHGQRLFESRPSRTASWGWSVFLLRREVLDPTNEYLKNGSLTVHVDIQVWTDSPVAWKPRK